ncbi:MAG: enoyl-CoA hydratase/isomerase family protein [Gemmatimonadetes bacterium]|nr:enoyl-CoA hydratase/isomerase family protein [Gemmatimonadota bacterium]MDA1102895.1 enoyl-CoA hydratase/isomerase family protein [Gemmatimonadota bacterium]
MSDSVLVHYEAKNKIAVLTLDDAPANTYTHEMMRQLDECIVRARFDRDVEVIVLTGAGEKFFCAGANIGMLSQSDPDWKYCFCLHANETLNRLEHTPKLVIAALNGHTVGGGLEIAMAADIRIARKDSGKVGLPEVALGVLPGTGGTQRLVRLVGKPKAIQLMAEGSTFGFDVAHKLGLVNEIYEQGDRDSFLAAVLEYAAQFTTPNKATKAVGLIKRSVQTGSELPFELALALERELQAQLFSSSDAKEGLNAYIEKRKPQFEGR